MYDGYDYKKNAVLFVDDEEKALKYFKKAFQDEFWVLTSSSVRQAEEMIEGYVDHIGIVITDQRMPGKTGVDLLEGLRKTHPNIVRMLTTAYSDIDSAIEAVNSGAILKYVVKPWNLKELRGCLLRGMEFFLVQQERDMLLREKMYVLQRLIISDRIRSLAIMAAGLSHQIRNPLTALKTFLDLTPMKLMEELGSNHIKEKDYWVDFWSTAKNESQKILEIIEKVSEVIFQSDHSFDYNLSLNELITKAVEEVKEEYKIHNINIDVNSDIYLLKADASMLERLFTLLIKRLLHFNRNSGTVKITVKENIQVRGTEGTKIIFLGEGQAWDDNMIFSLFSPFAIDEKEPSIFGEMGILPAFFITHHHSGEIIVHKETPNGPGFEIDLPYDPEAIQRPSLEKDFFYKIMNHFEIWDNLRADF